jgi:hypothetical protein
MIKRIFLLVLVIAGVGAGVWAYVHHFAWRSNRAQQVQPDSYAMADASRATWDEAVASVKADRGEPAGGNARVEIPPELKHYSDRHWFLATQVAEIEKYKIQTCQDFVDLAGMLERSEIVLVPAVTQNYILLGVGENADDDVFSRYEDDHTIELYSDAQLSDAYQRLEQNRKQLKSQITTLQSQTAKLTKRQRTKRSELQKQIGGLQQQLKSTEDDKARLNRFYGQPDNRKQLMHDYESLQTLARSFAGRSYNLDSSSDREALKVNMLRSLRPEAFKIMEEIAVAYHQQFERPLPVSSLIRPEQYQHTLRRINRNAILIDTPPHSTGLAFDIDYRYMSAAEQTFLMSELARLKNEGRIEVLRERNANYHVFAFVNGSRPTDELIAASLDQASEQGQEAHHAKAEPKRGKSAKIKSKTHKTKTRTTKSKATRHRRR